MIGIIVAMALEREAIQQHLEDYECVSYGRQNYYIGTISGRDVTLAECGVGKVASAITATRLIEHFGCDEIINIGTAGGIKEYENVLDVVVVDKSTYHDWDNESVNDEPRSFVTQNGYVFDSDPHLVELAKKTMEQFDDHKTYVGHIVSGDAFVRFDDLVQMIQKNFPEAVACDMESASIGHVCTMYDVPFVVIRSLSDIVIKEGNEMDFQTYARQASDRAARFTKAFLERH